MRRRKAQNIILDTLLLMSIQGVVSFNDSETQGTPNMS